METVLTSYGCLIATGLFLVFCLAFSNSKMVTNERQYTDLQRMLTLWSHGPDCGPPPMGAERQSSPSVLVHPSVPSPGVDTAIRVS